MDAVTPGVSVATLKTFVAQRLDRREAMVIEWRTATSNVDSPSYICGRGVRYVDSGSQPMILLCDVYRLDRGFTHPVDCGYLVDDGVNILPFSVTGWCLYDRSVDDRTCQTQGIDIPAGYLRLRRQRPMAPHGTRGPRRTWHLAIRPLGTD